MIRTCASSICAAMCALSSMMASRMRSMSARVRSTSGGIFRGRSTSTGAATLSIPTTRWRPRSRPLSVLRRYSASSALETSIPAYAPVTFTPQVQPQLRATAQNVLALLGKEGVNLIDARDTGQYSGKIVRGAPRPGHIPGALNIPREELIDPATGTFRSNDELAHVFSTAGVAPEQHVVAYCNGGVAATSVLFSLAMLGYPNLTNYDGSW